MILFEGQESHKELKPLRLKFPMLRLCLRLNLFGHFQPNVLVISKHKVREISVVT